MELSRRAIPYTPFTKDLSETTIALVSTAGVHLKSQEPYDLKGDTSFREIPADVVTSDLTVTHEHYDISHALADINCVFPIDRLRELHRDGVIGGIAPVHYGMMGYTLQMKPVLEQTAPEIARRIERSPTDAVLLTGG
ncbi:MAG TPA: glycine/sarcosine/betaine reductase selenoprotein B family protein [Candidatus Dormibacteraeota bacterium]|nr:glycine/sarcosine/betaine reductase selenoprotein B family protein [Candidatus Dormibacteraeota bacterium]